jgi:putative Mn2+ efflux pump MntP
MPLIGWFLGIQVANLINYFDHWIAFLLLSFLGFKRAYESLKKDEEKSNFNPLNIIVLFGMAIVTSIDTLVVGFSFAFIKMNIYLLILVIGIVPRWR